MNSSIENLLHNVTLVYLHLRTHQQNKTKMTDKQQLTAHLRMIKAATQTMLTNLKDKMSEEVQNELLDTLKKLIDEIERLEKEQK